MGTPFDPTCFGFYPTCWYEWPEHCPSCPRPTPIPRRESFHAADPPLPREASSPEPEPEASQVPPEEQLDSPTPKSDEPPAIEKDDPFSDSAGEPQLTPDLSDARNGRAATPSDKPSQGHPTLAESTQSEWKFSSPRQVLNTRGNGN